MVPTEILLEMEMTLAQLVENATVFRQVRKGALSFFEIDAFNKTQESLLAHYRSMEKILYAKGDLEVKEIAEKKLSRQKSRLEALTKRVERTISAATPRTPLLSKRKGKRFLIMPSDS